MEVKKQSWLSHCNPRPYLLLSLLLSLFFFISLLIIDLNEVLSEIL